MISLDATRGMLGYGHPDKTKAEVGKGGSEEWPQLLQESSQNSGGNFRSDLKQPL
jgi:hypothetical protein